MAKLCRGKVCMDPAFPILDYNAEDGECFCRVHPCWNDNGETHSCKPGGQHWHLEFSYTNHRALECRCSSAPHESPAPYLGRELCPGVDCHKNTTHPFLDYDA